MLKYQNVRVTAAPSIAYGITAVGGVVVREDGNQGRKAGGAKGRLKRSEFPP